MDPAAALLWALLPAAQATEVIAVELCPEVPPAGYRLERAYAEGPSDQALNAARSRARELMIERLCAGYDELRCAALQRHISSWGAGSWAASDRKGREGTACAAVIVEEAWLDQLGRDYDSFEASLAGLVTDLRDRAGESLLAIEPPTWESGCVAGPLGAAVGGELRSLLAGHPVVPEGAGDRSAAAVLTRLTPGAGGVRLNLTLRPSARSAVLLGGFAFPNDLFGVAIDERGRCRGDSDLGLAEGEKLGDGGLRVQLTVPTNSGLVCPGDALQPQILVSRQARVQVYSVAREGQGYLVWPSPGQEGLVDAAADLGTVYAVETPDLGDERMVAVAVPAGSYFGRSEGWTGFCRLEGIFGPVLYPSGAAIGTATYQVLPAGEGSCTGPARLADLAALEAAPICGD